jgi:hypothetical protein
MDVEHEKEARRKYSRAKDVTTQNVEDREAIYC